MSDRVIGLIPGAIRMPRQPITGHELVDTHSVSQEIWSTCTSTTENAAARVDGQVTNEGGLNTARLDRFERHRRDLDHEENRS